MNEKSYILGVDLGGSAVKSIVMDDESGELIYRPEIQIESLTYLGKPEITLQQMRKVALLALQAAKISPRQVRGVGLCTPGPATGEGVIYRSCNMPGHDGLDIRSRFENEIGMPVVYSNDCDAGALSESWLRRSYAVQRLVAVFVGTGLGGGKTDQGKLIVGRHGAAMEIGHMHLAAELIGERCLARCSCGGLGHAEAYISIKGIDRMLKQRLQLRQYRDHPLQSIEDHNLARAKMVRELAGKGDKLAIELLMVQARALGVLLHTLACADDPDLMVIGGGMTLATPRIKAQYLRRVRQSFDEVTMDNYRGRIGIEWALGDDAAPAHGAALHARDYFKASTQIRNLHGTTVQRKVMQGKSVQDAAVRSTAALVA